MSTRRVEVSGLVSKPNPAGSGRGHWALEVIGEALFHQFGADYEEFESGPGNYTTAVVEWPDGRITMVRADHVRFLDPTERGAA